MAPSFQSLFQSWESACARHCQGLDRPFVTISFAQSLDGCLAQQSGQRSQLSDAESWQQTHRMRSLHDGILVGRGTLMTDDPLLNVRHVQGPSPRPIVLDTHASCPASAKIFSEHPQQILLATACTDHAYVAAKYPNAVPLYVPMADGQLDLGELLKMLKDLGMRSIMVEGGAQVISSFIAQGLCDFLIINIIPTLLGNESSVRYKFDSDQSFDMETYGFIKGQKDFWTWGSLARPKPKLVLAPLVKGASWKINDPTQSKS